MTTLIAVEDAEKLDNSYLVAGNVKWYKLSQQQCDRVCLCVCSWAFIPEKCTFIFTQKPAHKCSHSSFIAMAKLKKTQICLNE